MTTIHLVCKCGWVGINGENDHEILNAGDKIKTWASWFPDGERILVEVETDTHKKLSVRTLHEATIRWLLDDPQRNIEEAFVPPGSDNIVVVEVRDTRLQASLLNPETGQEQPFPDLPGSLSPDCPCGYK